MPMMPSRTRSLVVAVLGLAAATAITAQQPAQAPVRVLPVQRNVHMLVTPDGNIAAQVGSDGVLLVDAAAPALVPQVMAALRPLGGKPLHTIVTTSVRTTNGSLALAQTRGPGPAVRVIAHEAVLNRLVQAQAAGSAPAAALRMNQVIELPINNAYTSPGRDFYLNGESVVIHHAPAAVTDGDSIVHFRGSDVVAVGDLFNPDVYPVIDLANGGSVNGLIAALNHILELTVPARYQEGGTYVIPRHGRLCDEAEVVEFRDMVTIIRDRVRDLLSKGRTLDEVKAARPSRDYDPEYGAASGPSAPDAFVEAVYRSVRDSRGGAK
jgi:glyoxylase-like metal-dependent hydrolase (beta-lactamase superfamily II)